MANGKVCLFEFGLLPINLGYGQLIERQINVTVSMFAWVYGYLGAKPLSGRLLKIGGKWLSLNHRTPVEAAWRCGAYVCLSFPELVWASLKECACWCLRWGGWISDPAVEQFVHGVGLTWRVVMGQRSFRPIISAVAKRCSRSLLLGWNCRLVKAALYGHV